MIGSHWISGSRRGASVTAARRWDRAEEAEVTEAEITYVNIDAEHRPKPLEKRPTGADG